MQVSQRAAQLPASPIRKLMSLAADAKDRGVHVHHLNIGQPDLHSPEAVRAALRAYDQDLIAYTASRGRRDYLDTLRGYYRRWGVELEREHINVTTGGSEAIVFALQATTDPGDAVLIPEPFYANYRTFAAVSGVDVVPVTTHVGDGFHLPDRETLGRCVTPNVRAFLLCNPSNPTGTVYTRSEIDAVLDLCREHDLWLIVDEVYREFVFDDAPDTYRTVLQLDDPRVIVVDSVSKRFSMCGARVGCAVSRHPDIMDAFGRMSDARLSPPGLGQYVAQPAYEAPASYIEEAVAEYRRRRDVLYDALNAIPGVSAGRPEGAFYTVVRLPVADTEDFARWLLTDFAEDGETVMVAPAQGFYATPGLGKSEVRIAYVLETERLKRAMHLLALALERYQPLTS